MSYSTVERTVTRREGVPVWTCDGCGRRVEGDAVPQKWLQVVDLPVYDGSALPLLDYCTRLCLLSDQSNRLTREHDGA